MVLGLLGSYDSDDSGGEGQDAPTAPAASPAQPQRPAKPPLPTPDPAPKPLLLTPDVAPGGARHTSACECEECDALMARFVAKNVQTKGIRFRCKLCSTMLVKKADASDHMQDSHADELQSFKRQKAPKLFEDPKVAAAVKSKKISFAREDVLGRKRKIDDQDVDFGGWAKKEKPEPPPCEQEGYQDMMQQDVITAPPWMNQAVPLSNDTEATDSERVVDQHVTQAQVKRFTGRNVLEVKKEVVRCKLCYKTFGSVGETEKHIFEAHGEEFNKELKIWHRFLHTTSKRQPPFGWVCKICNLFFPNDNSTFRHLGKEVFIRREQRHADAWKEKEDRWGHEDDQECCGDGMNVAPGLSFESVQKFQEEHRQEMERENAAAARASVGGDAGESSDDSEDDARATAAAQKKKLITEF